MTTPRRVRGVVVSGAVTVVADDAALEACRDAVRRDAARAPQVAMLDVSPVNLARLTNLEVDLSGYVSPQPYAEKAGAGLVELMLISCSSMFLRLAFFTYAF